MSFESIYVAKYLHQEMGKIIQSPHVYIYCNLKKQLLRFPRSLEFIMENVVFARPLWNKKCTVRKLNYPSLKYKRYTQLYMPHDMPINVNWISRNTSMHNSFAQFETISM